MKKIKTFFLMCIGLMVLIPVLNFNFKPNSVSAIDNRKLAESPFGQISGFTENLKNYINDRIGLRELAINLNTQMNDKLFNEMIHPSYEYGKDGQVFFKLKVEDPNYEFLDKYVDHVKNIQEYCNSRNVLFIYVNNPSKTTIYRDYLPEGYNYNNKLLDYLRLKLKEEEIEFVDNALILEEKAKEEQVFNVKYDVGHWNDLGAYYGINNILERVKKYYPQVKFNSMEDFNIVKETMTSLPVSQFKINEEVEKFVLKDEYKKI
ncbi:MAG: hypothetical protein Q4E02_02185 [Lagierella massiliensis]|nr:hypothetical protein [Lagierella massiliensis]